MSAYTQMDYGCYIYIYSSITVLKKNLSYGHLATLLNYT